MADRFGITEQVAERYVEGWQRENYLRPEVCDTRNKVSGLRVLKMLEPVRQRDDSGTLLRPLDGPPPPEEKVITK